ncbi:MAG: hypothetical protein COB15_13335 [Flavobacteriales bacterium]|nr:MAG: hypothetical protein COB15_13335 [Flavobacteriales bacterium]
MKKCFLFLVLLICFNNKIVYTQCNQGDVVTFQKVYGGSGNERAHSIQQTLDGGYIVVGETTSFGAGGIDIFVMKINPVGAQQWSKTYGGTGNEFGHSIIIKETSDLGFIVSGHTESFGAGSLYDSYLLKLDNLGNIQWEKRITGSSYDSFRDVIELSNGDFVLTGSAASFSVGNMDAHLVKISSTGNLIWINNIGTVMREHSQSLLELPGGNYIVSGNTNITDTRNAFLIKVDVNGNVIWSKEYGWNGRLEDFSQTKLLNDNNLLSIGWSISGGDINVLAVKTDTLGNLIWSKVFSGISNDYGVNVVEKTNGELMIVGLSNSFGSGNEIIQITTDATGNVLTSKYYGGLSNDAVDYWGYPIDINSNDELIIAGGTTSFGSVGEDVYIVKANYCGDSFCNEQNVAFNVSSLNIPVQNFTSTNISGGSLVNTNTIVNSIAFTEVYLCIDSIYSCDLTSNFSADSLCSGDTTSFTDLSIDNNSNIINWQWYFGDGDSIVGVQNPSHLYTSTGTFNVTLAVTNDSNCVDSITIPIDINPVYNLNITDSICQGDSILLEGSFQNLAGIYTDSLQSVFGCDSIITTALTINPIFSSIQNQTICQGDSVLFGGTFYNNTGIYTDSLQIILGCDSLEILDLTVNPSYQIGINQTICQGDSILFGGIYYSSPGIYTDSLQTILSCDSILIFDLTVNPSYQINASQTVCQGDSIFLGGSFQNVAGIYIDSLQSVNGCDSIITTTLTINPIFSSIQNQTICQGDSIFLGGVFQNLAGIYTDSLQSVNGCDSIITTTLTINPIFSSIQNQTICQGDSILFGGIYYKSTGVYTVSLQTVLGCDSLEILDLTVNPSYQISMNQTICQGDSIFLAGVFQHLAGIYTDNLQSVNGCDSTLYTDLQIDITPQVIASLDTLIDKGSQVQLSAIGGDSYVWIPNYNLSCDDCQNPISFPKITTTYIVEGKIGDCISYDTVIVSVNNYDALLFAPNSFTPNNDGLNDVFNIYGENIKEFKILIFNRWGELLFESNNIKNGWNGIYKGIKVPVGVYVYKVEAVSNNFSNYKKTGHINLVR